ncbi:hypothetical protein PLICRDRAFT_179412 [Plicaturopsis crispa FD-325 SS-3]|uniref:Aminoglycoside phosphotransferase domain-containing protein n=1 Tax=Plicaturopsis crispa FD-325 SS-3 TaxID=944288 RepID=A0A0C9SRE9_PLICR|nr:hypothetical protein PLICRDRAFT_179412 [Plicaturopsis crispa FD-325 SS-3]
MHGTLTDDKQVLESISEGVKLTGSLLEWDWDTEHADRKREAKADAALHGAQPFQVDRRLLKDVVREKMGCEVGRITFLSSGTFHKAYLVTLTSRRELVARVARRYMPRLKTESEVATMHYLREKTSVPVPTVYFYDSNPYNRLGGEYILMSKAPGIPLSRVYHSMSNQELVSLLENIASIVIPLFAHRFNRLGSLYSGPPPNADSIGSSTAPTPKATNAHFSFSTMSKTGMSGPAETPKSALALSRTNSTMAIEFHVGPIISWPFFGSGRGELMHPGEINRGPWSSTYAYLRSCADREVSGVVRENEGKAAPHRLHLDPDAIRASRHHHLRAVPGDESDESDEWDLDESEGEWDGPGDVMYRDYRRMQRSTFLVAHMATREETVRQEMNRWVNLMERLGVASDLENGETFGIDLHDLSLENVFVDAHDVSKITCVIDWESTTTRPLWACAHLPAFLESSPFTADRFREAVAKLAVPHASHTKIQPSKLSKDVDVAALAREWLHFEAAGTRLRMAHRFVEWDGWEEGLIDTILGPEDEEEEWFKDVDADADHVLCAGSPPLSKSSDSEESPVESILVASLKRRKAEGARLPFAKEKEKVQMLNTTGDICGGRGGELGRRLEAWLTVGGAKRPSGEVDGEYDAEAE